jgi:hypothetical protein
MKAANARLRRRRPLRIALVIVVAVGGCGTRTALLHVDASPDGDPARTGADLAPVSDGPREAIADLGPASCGAAATALQLELCLVGPVTLPGNPMGPPIDFGGKLVGVDLVRPTGTNPLACSERVQRSIVIDEGGGRIWKVGFAVVGGATDRLEQALAEKLGSEVRARFRLRRGFGTATGFALTDGRGLVAALENGTWGPGLDPADTPGVSVRPGAVVCSLTHVCGTQLHKELLFDAGNSVRVAAGAVASFMIGASSYGAQNVATYDWAVPVGCTDLAGLTSWVLWRVSP